MSSSGRRNLLRRGLLAGLVGLCLTTQSLGGDLLQAAFARQMEAYLAGRDGSVLLLDAATGKKIAAIHSGCFYDQPRPIGSLIKPFTALAFLAENPGEPQFTCPRSEPGASQIFDCWYHPGHGKIGLKEALAFSCNHYFYRLSLTIPWDRFLTLLGRAHLADPAGWDSPASSAEERQLDFMTGRNGRMRIRPVDLALAYAALFNGGRLYAVTLEDAAPEFLGTPFAGWNTGPVQAGMLASAQYGTGRLAASGNQRLYVKTGTTGGIQSVSDSDAFANPTEGWCVAVNPDSRPPLLILARIKPGKGAGDAAPLAGEGLRIYRRLVGATAGESSLPRAPRRPTAN